jgi:hypothetical protein
MADFCKACSIDIFGEDFKELALITKEEDWKGGKACTALCEGCGFIQVDPEGNCVSPDCFEETKPGHGLPWVRGNKRE